MRIAPLPPRWFRVSLLAAVILQIAAFSGLQAETIPPIPRNHFNDYANVVSDSVERELNDRLAQFERETTNQVVVAVFSRMDSTAPVRDYTLRVAKAWGVGRSDHDNGVVLFAFMQERQLYLQVGVGLESRISDSLAQRIIDQDIVPRFRSRDIDGGLRSGVDAILFAIRTEPVATHSAAPSVEHHITQETPVEASAAPQTSPPTEAPASHDSYASSFPVSSPISASPGINPGGIFVAFVVLIIVIAAVRALAGVVGDSQSQDGGIDYDSAQPRRGSTIFGRRTSTWDHRPRPGGFGGSNGRSSGGGSFSRGGGGFRGGGAGGGW